MAGQYPYGNRGQFNPQQQPMMNNAMGQMPGMQSPSQQQMMQQQQQMQHMQQQQHVMGPGGGMQSPSQQQMMQQQMQHGPHGLSGAGGMQQQVSQHHSGGSTSHPQAQQMHPQQHHQHHHHPPPPQPGNILIAQPKEINIVALSRLGQETVQDITSRFQEIFAALKIIQPTANRDNNTEKKVQEYFRTIRLLFKRVRIIYEKCNDGYPQVGMEYTQVESLIPYKEEPDHRPEPVQCEEYRKALQENQELIEIVKLKNRQLREIIDRTRIIIWEINTMLSMRRS